MRCAEGVPLIPTPGIFHESFARYVKPDSKWIASEARAFRCLLPMARHTQPVTGGGIIPRLEGGMIAGTVAHKVIRQKDVSAKVLREYETAWSRRFGKSNKRSYKIKGAIIDLSDEELNSIGRAIFAGDADHYIRRRG